MYAGKVDVELVVEVVLVDVGETAEVVNGTEVAEVVVECAVLEDKEELIELVYPTGVAGAAEDEAPLELLELTG